MLRLGHGLIKEASIEKVAYAFKVVASSEVDAIGRDGPCGGRGRATRVATPNGETQETCQIIAVVSRATRL